MIWSLLMLGAVLPAQDIRWFADASAREGAIFASAGMHRSTFASSSIHLAGEGYELTLHDVAAHDVPEITSIGFQYNFKLGYFLSDHWSVTAIWTHFKYVMDPDQVVPVSGFVSAAASPQYAGRYARTPTQVGLRADIVGGVEHTDGLSFFGLEGGYTHDVVQLGDHVVLAALYAASFGPIVTLSDYDRFGTHYRDEYRVSGVGLTASVGLRLELYRYVFFDGVLLGAHAILTDVLGEGELTQSITFGSALFQVGFRVFPF